MFVELGLMFNFHSGLLQPRDLLRSHVLSDRECRGFGIRIEWCTSRVLLGDA